MKFVKPGQEEQLNLILSKLWDKKYLTDTPQLEKNILTKIDIDKLKIEIIGDFIYFYSDLTPEELIKDIGFWFEKNIKELDTKQ